MALTVGTNTYVTLTEADTYFSTHLQADAWTGATTGTRTAALLQACRALDRLHYVGFHPQRSQALQWPRYGSTTWTGSTTFSGIVDNRGWDMPGGVVPQDIKDAQCEEALALLQMAADPDAISREMTQRQGVTRVQVGTTEETYGARQRPAGLLSGEARALLAPYLLRSPRKVLT